MRAILTIFRSYYLNLTQRAVCILSIVLPLFVSAQLPPLQSDQMNVGSPELGPKVVAAYERLTNNPDLNRRLRSDRALQALYIQVLNQLQHVSFKYKVRDASYVHDFVIAEQYPHI